MNASSVVQLLLNVGTFCTSLVSLFTLFEMVKQRRASMMPRLFIKNTCNLHIMRKHTIENGNLAQIRSVWSEDIHDSIEDQHLTISPTYSIELFNAGIGTATNIEYKWKFDVEGYLNRLQEFNSLHDIEIIYKKSMQGFYIGAEAEVAQTFGLENDDYKISFLPSSQSVKIQLPSEFTILFNLLLCSIFITEDEDTNNKTAENILDLEKELDKSNLLELHICYSDIAGKKYKKKYSICLSGVQYSLTSSMFLMKINEV